MRRSKSYAGSKRKIPGKGVGYGYSLQLTHGICIRELLCFISVLLYRRLNKIRCLIVIDRKFVHNQFIVVIFDDCIKHWHCMLKLGNPCLVQRSDQF